MVSSASGSIALRPWTLDDAPELAALYAANRDELSVSEPWRPADFYTVAGQRRRIAEVLAGRTVLNFVILEGASIVGTLGFEEITVNDGGSADVGYWVDTAHRRRNIATTAVALAVNYGFSRLGLIRIRANVEADNIASRRVLERNGFLRIGQRFIDVAGSRIEHLVFERTPKARSHRGPR